MRWAGSFSLRKVQALSSSLETSLKTGTIRSPGSILSCSVCSDGLEEWVRQNFGVCSPQRLLVLAWWICSTNSQTSSFRDSSLGLQMLILDRNDGSLQTAYNSLFNCPISCSKFTASESPSISARQASVSPCLPMIQSKRASTFKHCSRAQQANLGQRWVQSPVNASANASARGVNDLRINLHIVGSCMVTAQPHLKRFSRIQISGAARGRCRAFLSPEQKGKTETSFCRYSTQGFTTFSNRNTSFVTYISSPLISALKTALLARLRSKEVRSFLAFSASSELILMRCSMQTQKGSTSSKAGAACIHACSRSNDLMMRMGVCLSAERICRWRVSGVLARTSSQAQVSQSAQRTASESESSPNLSSSSWTLRQSLERQYLNIFYYRI